MIDIKKDDKSDDFIIKKAVKIDGRDLAEEYRLSASDMSQLFNYFCSSWSYIYAGTRLDKAVEIIKKDAAKSCFHTIHYAFFNDSLIDSDMTVDEAYEKVLGLSKAEVDAKIKEEKKEI